MLGGAVSELIDHVGECRTLQHADVELPEGIYWFEGVAEGTLLLQVVNGPLPGGAMTVPLDQLDQSHPLAAAWGWAEQLWQDAAAVPDPLFPLNEAVVTHPGNDDAVILGRRFVGTSWLYTVAIDGRQQSIMESRLKPRPQLDDPTEWVTREPTPAHRFGATLTRAKLRGKFADTLFSFRATRTTFRPYQFKPVIKLLHTGRTRLLIADEVGLGKTIEAGLIWTELEARREADRVLVVCPAGLVGKWKEEMSDRFEFDLIELNGATLDDFLHRHRQNRLPPRQAYICSLERLRTWEGLTEFSEFPPTFDLVIVDEAHAMRNQDTKSHALGTQLAEWADSLVFLTATPINLRQEDLLNLLRLLAPEDYSSIDDLQRRLEPNRIINAVGAQLVEKDVNGTELLATLNELHSTQLGAALTRRPDFSLLSDLLSKGELAARDIVNAKRLLADLNTLSTVITRTKKVEVDDRKAKRTLDRQEVTWAAEELDFYEEYLRWCQVRASDMNSPLHFAMQMPLRLASACLPMARRAVLDPHGFGKLSDADSGETSARLEPHPDLVAAARRLHEGIDSKFDLLQNVLERLHRGGRQALVFTHSVPTLFYLRSRLEREFRVAVMYGAVKREQRREIMAEFRAGGYDFVLANRVASEGLDFEFCSAVINYDLPWNPMEIEQRIGRIDRIGQVEETVLVVNFVNDQTIDEHILSRLLDRIGIFESAIGALEPIISLNAAKALEDGFNFKLTEEQREQKLHEVEMAIEEQRAGAQDVSDASSALLISNDVDVAGLEVDLVRTGRYIGQQELAQLLDDWARIDGGSGLRMAKDHRTAEFRGNAAMAGRMEELAASQQRTAAEVSTLAAQLRNELAIPLVLDQELARTGGGILLTATNPLTMAAVTVPDHRHARFASLRLMDVPDDVVPGTYLVVMAKAVAASRGGDEIWGAAVTQDGRPAGDGPVNALLAALAEGKLVDAPLPGIDRLDKLAERAQNRLDHRHADEQVKRDQEFDALRRAQVITLTEQHARKVQAIEKRIATVTDRGRDARYVALFEAQLRRAQQRFDWFSAELENKTAPEIRLEPLAACVVRVGN